MKRMSTNSIRPVQRRLARLCQSLYRRYGSLGISVVDTRIWGGRALAPPNPASFHGKAWRTVDIYGWFGGKPIISSDEQPVLS
jgi:hypothetical protein